MKLKVPFVKDFKKWQGRGWCGPITLASLLRYYKDRSSVQEIVKISGTLKRKPKAKYTGGTTIDGLIFFCLLRGFNVDYINKYKRFSYT